MDGFKPIESKPIRLTRAMKNKEKGSGRAKITGQYRAGMGAPAVEQGHFGGEGVR
ncbi:MAG: hypothetical protein KM312_00145 [Hydrogenibacillus schlegelii]|uniref:Uncharacterized protein n=1 Tax=Hydrogenibacillus schlegelii TaxID=1484 RepID=A0A2T5GD34_HYDSH|nr:hypothetical protein [Hydrogenibacillus schlegelii]PTQ54101.1 MAG: hypothetical protein HSCHL_0745 [Hydrogenibacillus schlegelii]